VNVARIACVGRAASRFLTIACSAARKSLRCGQDSKQEPVYVSQGNPKRNLGSRLATVGAVLLGLVCPYHCFESDRLRRLLAHTAIPAQCITLSASWGKRTLARAAGGEPRPP
jgi:hypothetical protein